MGLFRSLFGHRKSALRENEEESVPETSKVEENPVVEETLEQKACLPEISGTLLEVWNAWAGGQKPHTISLTHGKTAEELFLDAETVTQERERIQERLQQDAQKWLDERVRVQKGISNRTGAQCNIYLSQNKLVAWMFLFPPIQEDWKITPKFLSDALQRAGVVTGVDAVGMLRCIQEVPYFRLTPIAIGTPPVEGKDGKIVEYFERPHPEDEDEDSGESVEKSISDYRRVMQYIKPVKEKDVLCELLPFEEGTPGLQVDGRQCNPKAVQKPRLARGMNTVLSEDGQKLLAKCDGYLRVNGDTVEVSKLLEINGDVDMRTGDVKFEGDIHITGDVCDEVTVWAGGKIMIDGVVEMATIETESDLTIVRGVIGNNQVLLKCKGTFKAKYLDSCVLYAGKGVYSDYIMNSQVFCDERVNVTSGRGIIVGGTITAAYGIKAKVIGAESERPTELTLGIRSGAQTEQDNLQTDLDTVQREKQEVYQELIQIVSNLGMEGSSAALAKAQLRKAALEEKEKELLEKQEQISPYIPDLRRCQLESNIVYPNTTLHIAGATWTTRQDKKMVRLTYNDKEKEIHEY